MYGYRSQNTAFLACLVRLHCYQNMATLTSSTCLTMKLPKCEFSDVEQRTVFHFFTLHREKVINICKLLHEYGDNCTDESTVSHWVCMFEIHYTLFTNEP